MNRIRKVIALVLAAVMLLMTAAAFAGPVDQDFDSVFVAGVRTLKEIIASGQEAILSLQVETLNHRYNFILASQEGDQSHLALEMYYDGDMRTLLGTEYDAEQGTRYHWFAPASTRVTALSDKSIPRIAVALVRFLSELGAISDESEALIESADIESVEVDFKEKYITSVLMKLLSFNPWEDKSVLSGIPFAGDTTVNTDEMYCVEIRENFLPSLLAGIDKILFSNNSVFSHEDLIAFLNNTFGRVSGSILVYGTTDFEDEDLQKELICIRIPFTSKEGEEFTLVFNFGEDGYLTGSGRMYLSIVKEANGEETKFAEINCDNTVTEDSVAVINLPSTHVSYAYKKSKENILPDGQTVVTEEGTLRLSPGITEDEIIWRVVIVPGGETEEGAYAFKAYFYHGDELFTEADAELQFRAKEPEALVHPEETDILYFEKMTPEEISDVLMDTFIGMITNTVDIFSELDVPVYPDPSQLTEL